MNLYLAVLVVIVVVLLGVSVARSRTVKNKTDFMVSLRFHWSLGGENGAAAHAFRLKRPRQLTICSRVFRQSGQKLVNEGQFSRRHI